jgi:preprotein translocase subunit SecG
MENVVLAIHLILALLLAGVVLMQRSEGGGLGMGGGGAMSGRGVATALTKLTWIFAAGFIVTSITLTIFAAANSTGSSVTDQLGIDAPAAQTPADALGTDLLPPAATDAPATPPAADAPATPPAPAP